MGSIRVEQPAKGARFGRRVVVRPASHGRQGMTRTTVRCDCGSVDTVSTANLIKRLSDQCRSCAARAAATARIASGPQ